MYRNYILIGPDSKNTNNNHPGGMLTASKGLSQYVERKGISLHIIDNLQSSFPKPPLYRRFYKSCKRFLNLINYLRRKKVDGVIAFSSSGFSLIEKLIYVFVCRLFQTPHLLFLRSGHFFNSLNGFSKFIFKFLLKVPQKIAVQGHNWESALKTIGLPEKKIEVIPNWVPNQNMITNQRDPKKSKHDELPSFIYVGWLVKEKGVLDLVECYRKSELLTACKLYILGDGTLYKNLSSQINRYNLKEIKMMGWCDEKTVHQTLKEADILVLPSYAEGFPNSIMEALSFGLPVISTNIGGIPDSIIDNWNGFIINPGDQSKLKRVMEYFVKDKNLINRFSKNSLKILTERHSQDLNCSKLFEALEPIN